MVVFDDQVKLAVSQSSNVNKDELFLLIGLT